MSSRKSPIPDSWLDAQDAPQQSPAPAFIQDVVAVMNHQEGDSIPVSTVVKYGMEDGTWPAGTSKFESAALPWRSRSGTPPSASSATSVLWSAPHAAIRPILLGSAEESAKPAGFDTVDAKGMSGKYTYRLQVSPYDCTGCGSCVNVCLAKETALTMRPFESQLAQADNWTYGVEQVEIKRDAISDKNVKASQFAKPYFEFLRRLRRLRRNPLHQAGDAALR